MWALRGQKNNADEKFKVNVGSGVEKLVVNKKVWDSKARKSQLRSIVYDGNKLAW